MHGISWTCLCKGTPSNPATGLVSNRDPALCQRLPCHCRCRLCGILRGRFGRDRKARPIEKSHVCELDLEAIAPTCACQWLTSFRDTLLPKLGRVASMEEGHRFAASRNQRKRENMESEGNILLFVALPLRSCQEEPGICYQAQSIHCIRSSLFAAGWLVVCLCVCTVCLCDVCVCVLYACMIMCVRSCYLHADGRPQAGNPRSRRHGAANFPNVPSSFGPDRSGSCERWVCGLCEALHAGSAWDS